MRQVLTLCTAALLITGCGRVGFDSLANEAIDAGPYEMRATINGEFAVP